MVKKKSKLPSSKTKNNPLRINPFELKFNRPKHNVAGHPGRSRKRASEKREKSLGVEYNRLGKVNKIIDKRMGEKNWKMSDEEKAYLRRDSFLGHSCSFKHKYALTLFRFSTERAKHLKRSSRFNLEDDNKDFSEILTHGGEALTAVQKYDKTIASDDEDDAGTISADVVETAHFGGGELNTSSNNEHKLSRKEIIAELIAKTRQARENKRIAKDEMETITEELDAKYLKIMDKVRNSFRATGVTKTSKVEGDDYDKLAMSLKLNADSRATPAERTKTPEEIAMDERSRLEALESLRIAGIEMEKSRLHLSVDSDGVSKKSGSIKERNNFEVRFDLDGKLMNSNEVEPVSRQKITLDSDDDLMNDEFYDKGVENLNYLIEEDSSLDENISRVESDQNMSVRVDGTHNDDGDNRKEERHFEKERNEHGLRNVCSGDHPYLSNRFNEAVSSGIQESEVPFIIAMPENYDGLVNLIRTYPIQKIDIVLERLMKCYHPSLAEGNKKLLTRLFLNMLRFFDDSSNRPFSSDLMKMLGLLVNVIVRCIRSLIRQNWKKRLCNISSPTPFSVVTLLRLIASLYRISDNWHPVCSPAMNLAAMTLSKCHVVNLSILAQQILLVTVISDFVEQSMRFVPEALAFCQGALLLAVENEENECAPTVVFPISLPHRHMLYVEESLPNDATLEPLKILDVFTDGMTLEDCDMKRCQVLRALIAVIQKYAIIYAVSEYTFTATFTPFLVLLKRLPIIRYPSILTEEIEFLVQSIESEIKKRSQMTQMSRVVTEKRMLEPRLEAHFDPERPRMNRDHRRKGANAEKERLKYLVKKEMRGAIKELRKDASFLRRKQRKEIAIKDRERREKTKRLLCGLQSQQSEWNRELWESGKKRKK
ncbi:Nop14-like family protein [Dictyocaulus viviparus]|uniref:Nop14-like family protein n=1 Tax=Dictyocaulus viviparus TaxID=29172 RepID=A0A0D8XPE5_DICVI|nr:Nop14-like family protein [Dictyocaulus viviparus]